MTSVEAYAFVYGMAATCCLLGSLMCGLQLCWNILIPNPIADKTISRLLGTVLLVMACSIVCYILCAAFEQLRSLMIVGSTLDHLSFIGIAYLAYFLYSNNQPSKLPLILIASPFVIMAAMNLFLPSLMDILKNVAVFILSLIYVILGIAMHKREKHLDDLYTDPESHSIRWIWGIVAISVGWWLMHILFHLEALYDWYDIAMYLYSAGCIIFATIKVSRYASPVSIETQTEIEQSDFSEIPATTSEVSNPLRLQLLRLLEEDNIHLNPDLKIDDVARLLGTNAKTLSTILHNDMHTSFSTLINGYRINRAIHLLQNNDEKVTNISYQCGFNSNQVFFRAFSKVTGTTPSEWRKSHLPECQDITPPLKINSYFLFPN